MIFNFFTIFGTVKFLAFIMSICFLGFSSLCFAETNCKTKTDQEILDAKDNCQKECKKEKQTDNNCSSSCLGYCSLISTLLQDLSYYIISSKINNPHNCPAYHKFYNKELAFSIWQPPKIA